MKGDSVEREATREQRRRGLVWSERNLDGKPFFLLNKSRDRRNRISVREKVKLENGLESVSDWDVIGHPVLGLPGAYDQDVYVASLMLLDAQGGPDEEGRLWYKPYQMLKALGQDSGGASYEQLAESIERVSGTHVLSGQGFSSAKLKQRTNKKGFSLWSYDRAEHFGARGSNLELSYLEFHSTILESFEHGCLDRLDAAFYMDLSGPLSKRLFRLLNERCDGSGAWTADALTLRDLVPLSETYRHASAVLRKLDKAYEELRGRGFLHDVSHAKADGATLLTHKLSPSFGRRRLLDITVEEPGGKQAVDLLVSYRMRAEEAAALVVEYGADACIRAGEALPQQKGVRNLVGWLKSAIKDGYRFPEQPSDGRRPWRGPSDAPPKGGASSPTERDADPGGEAQDGHALRVPKPLANPAAEELWEEVLSLAAEEIDAPAWRVWFEGTVAVALGDSRLTISVPNPVAEEYITNRFKKTLEKHLRGLRDEGWAIAIVVPRKEAG